MPPAADVHEPARPRSPRLVRLLLLGACGAGLLGLGLPGTNPSVQALSVTPASATTLVEATEPAVLHAPRVAPPRVAPRATRSRTVAKAPAVRRTVAKKKATGRWVRPSYAGIVSYYGPRWGRMHKGVDFGAGYGDPIRAAGDGVVIGSGYLGSESGYGIITLIRHSNGYVTAYAHQAKSFVSAGERVTAGEVIGKVGSTGHSTGAHLHFEVRTATHSGQINPLPWLRARGVSI